MKALTAFASLALAAGVWAGDIISTDGFSNCGNSDSSIQVQNLDISFDRSTSTITFNVAGTSKISQDVTASLIVTAYGVNVYNQTFDPCAASTKVDQLCPVPAGSFSANGSQQIPTAYADKIPSIAYSIPDLDGQAQMVLQGKDGSQAACIQSSVTNGKSVELPAVAGIAGAIAAGALLVSGLSAAMAGGHPGASHSSPGFMEVMWWFQSMAMDGMYSVNYPGIYRSYTKNFAFATGIIPWSSMQNSIDNFRKSTGGNITDNNYEYLRNSTLRFQDGSTATPSGAFKRLLVRGLDVLFPRQLDGITTSVNGTSSASSSSSKESNLVSGIQAYVEQLTVPDANAFMTILLVFAIVIAAIVVGILLFKVILETWALFGKFPKSLSTFRKEYWRVMAQTITSLVLLLYGVWTLYCIFQFKHGDSWAAKILAGVTLGLFTALLLFYTWRIWTVAKTLKRAQGDSSALFEDKKMWKKYKIFYENYKKQYWWLFVPFIVYMFARGCILAGGDGHGLVQTIGQLAIESIMLILLLWTRPYSRKSGNWINIIIQVVRVLSVACILIFVEELGIPKTTQTITGVVLIVVQASLTGILAVLIAINAIINCCKENPHRKKRKAAEMAKHQDLEGDAFLMDVPGNKHKDLQMHTREVSQSSLGGYDDMLAQAKTNRSSRYGLGRGDSQDYLVQKPQGGSISKGGYKPVSQDHTSDESPQQSLSYREPRFPDMGYSGHPQRSY